MMMYLAGLQGIPQELCEAATIDGANAVKVFTRIKLPMLKPYIWFCSLNSVISAIGVFDVVFVLTKGGPNDATMVINYYSYTESFLGFPIWVCGDHRSSTGSCHNNVKYCSICIW